MAILITRIIAKRTQFSEAPKRYWELWSEARASPVSVLEGDLKEAHWLEGEAKKLRDFMLRMSERQEKTLDVPAVVEAVQDGKYYQVARVVKGPPVSPEEQDWIDEMASRIRQQVAEIQSVQQARIDALKGELAGKQRRIDKLVAMIQTQQARITALESEADQATAENLPAESPAESVAEDEEDGAWSAANLFHPVDPALADEDADDVPVPPRPSVDEAEMPTPEIRTERLMHPHKPQVILCYEANMDLMPDPEYLKVLSAFIEACKDDQYLDYIQSGFSRLRRLGVHRYRLFRAGMLERSVETFDKLRPSAAGKQWYRQHTEPQEEAPKQDKSPVEAGVEIRTERLIHPSRAHVVLCYEANMDLTPDPEYLKVLSTFIVACKGSQYLDYFESSLSKFRVYYLFRAGMLERSIETFDKLRPSAAGKRWYRQHTELQEEAPKQDKPPVEAGVEIRTERLMHPSRAHVVLCYEANMDLAPDPEYLEVLSAFIEVCQDGQYLNYSQANLPKAQVDHLYLAGMLECSVTASYKLRPSAAGELWHRQHTTSQAEAPRQEIVIDSSKVEQIRKKSGEIRGILSENDAVRNRTSRLKKTVSRRHGFMPMRETHHPSRTGRPFSYKVHEAAVDTPVEVICLSSKKMAGLCATGPYMGKLRQVIIDFKYKNATEFAKPLAERLVTVLEGRKWVFDIIIPVPLSDERLEERGYNQANLLGQQVAKQMNIPCRPGDLWRKWDTDQQTQLNAKQRVENVKNAFAAGTDVDNRSVLLIDDVMATGSTLEACADALKRAGVKAVYAIAVAKTTIY